MARKAFYAKDSNVGALVRKAETDFTSTETTVSKYVQFSIFEDISRIYAYLESKHISGDKDSMGRDKPFFNIVLAARNIWFRATDIDRKNIKFRSTSSKDDIATLLATIHLQEWMRRENFGQFLNAWGINSAGFNESVLKFVEQDGRLIPSVIPWNRIICDQVDFENNPKIEILEMTEGQLKQRKGYNQKMVDKLCKAAKVARKTTDEQTKDNKSNYIRLYEVHGLLPLSWLTDDEEDEEEYVQQMHVISFLEANTDGENDDFTLFRGRESKDPYMLGTLLPEIDGSIALRGSVKTLFDAQWMQNHTNKAVKDQLDLASKLIFQTSDTTFVGQNVLNSIENGDILIHKNNEPLTQIANTSHDTESLANYGKAWKNLANEIAGISEAMLGQNPPSGQAWRTTGSLLIESHSLFELMTENKGLAIEEMMRKFVIPYLKKQMSNSKEIAATLSAHDIDQIDSRFIKNVSIQQSNKVVREMILEGMPVSPDQQQVLTDAFAANAKETLQGQGNIRYFRPSEISSKTWRELFKDFEWQPEVDVTNENLDKEALSTLNTVFATIGQNPAILQDPTARMIFNQILRLTGAVSPVEIAATLAPKEAPAQTPDQISYAEAPEDVRRQLEVRSGLRPSQIPTPVPTNTPAPEVPAGR